jgi:hypothetical protein
VASVLILRIIRTLSGEGRTMSVFKDPPSKGTSGDRIPPRQHFTRWGGGDRDWVEALIKFMTDEAAVSDVLERGEIASELELPTLDMVFTVRYDPPPLVTTCATDLQKLDSLMGLVGGAAELNAAPINLLKMMAGGMLPTFGERDRLLVDGCGEGSVRLDLKAASDRLRRVLNKKPAQVLVTFAFFFSMGGDVTQIYRDVVPTDPHPPTTVSIPPEAVDSIPTPYRQEWSSTKEWYDADGHLRAREVTIEVTSIERPGSATMRPVSPLPPK